MLVWCQLVKDNSASQNAIAPDQCPWRDGFDIEGRAASAGASAKRGRYAPRKPGKVAARDAKLARKIVRRRK